MQCYVELGSLPCTAPGPFQMLPERVLASFSFLPTFFSRTLLSLRNAHWSVSLLKKKTELH